MFSPTTTVQTLFNYYPIIVLHSDPENVSSYFDPVNICHVNKHHTRTRFAYIHLIIGFF